jgi:hypothetical protein
MTLFEKIVWYRKHYGTVGLLRKGMRMLGGERKVTDPAMAAVQARAASVPTIEHLLAARFFRQRPLRTYPVKRDTPQVVLITDSVSRGSLFGGVATAILLATLVARRLGYRLRVVCRQEHPDEKSVQSILALNRVDFRNKISFSFIDASNNLSEVDITDDDVIITTSWWTTASAVGGLGTRRMFYLLQEDERMFYPHDDDHLRCSSLMEMQSVKLVVNSELLYRHLEAGGLTALAERGIWFEPAFQHARRDLPLARAKGKRNFFFYARPHHPRNLFYLGLEVIQACVHRGVLDPEEWDFNFVGADIPDLTIVDGVPVRRHEALPWAKYIELIRSVDLGLSLMYTPHPSYPPLDLAAGGAVVVTNTYANKTDLGRYCENIICANPDVEALVRAVAQGVALEADRPRRARNLASAGLENDWSKALEPAVEFIGRG